MILKRIPALSINANISEYQLSIELGQSKNYIKAISSSNAMLSTTGLLNICDYFNITSTEFFDTSTQAPELLNKVISTIKHFSEDNFELILKITKRMKNET